MKTEISQEIDFKKITLRDLVKIGESAVESDETRKSRPRANLNDFESEEKSKKNGILDGFLAPYKERFEELKNLGKAYRLKKSKSMQSLFLNI